MIHQQILAPLASKEQIEDLNAAIVKLKQDLDRLIDERDKLLEARILRPINLGDKF